MLPFLKNRSVGVLVGLAAIAALGAGYASAGSSANVQENIIYSPPAESVCHDCARPYAKIPLTPPANFNPLTASDAQIAVYGFPPRPNAKTSPGLYTDWARLVSAHATRIIPQLQATRVINGPIKNRSKVQSAGVKNGVLGATSNNWSGYSIIDNTDPFAAVNTKIIATFIVPRGQLAFGSCKGAANASDYSSQWVGIDGDNSPDVFQAGVEVDAQCVSGATVPFYSAWYEWFPLSETRISNFTIAPGDEIHLYIWNTSSTTGNMYMLDETRNKAVTLAFTAPSGTTLVGNSAEWIVERPGVNGGLATLTNYTSVEWEAAVLTAGGHDYSPNLATPSGQIYSLTMLDDSDAPISTGATSARNLIYTSPTNTTTTTSGTALWFANQGSSRGP